MNDIWSALTELCSNEFEKERVLVQAKNMDLTYELNLDSNFEDREAFVTGISKFIEETSILNTFNKIVEIGFKTHGAMMYSWRNLSSTLPDVPKNESSKLQFYKDVHDVLSPEIEMLVSFFSFVKNEARPAFIHAFQKGDEQIARKESVSQGVISSLAYVVDMFFVLDSLKDTKVSLKNDFSTFKRFGTLIKDPNFKLSSFLTNASETNELSLFLAQSQQILTMIKQDLYKQPSYQEILGDMINLCCSRIEEKSYLIPEEKFKMIRAIVASLTLLDNPRLPITKLDKSKKISLSRIEKIIKEFPVVPMIGDMQLNVPNTLKKLSTIDYSGSFSFFDSQHKKFIDSRYNLMNYVTSIHERQLRVITDLGRVKSQLLNSSSQSVNMKCSLSLKDEWSIDSINIIFGICETSIQHLSYATENLQLIYAWKMTHPSESVSREIGNEADPYELLTKYNYNALEKICMVKGISYIKSLFNLLSEMETIVLPAIYAYIYNETKEFLKTRFTDFLNKISGKSKLDIIRMAINGMKSACLDITPNSTTSNASSNKKTSTLKKRDTDTIVEQKRSKSVTPLSSQIYMITTTLSSLLATKEYRKELDSVTVHAIEDFLGRLNVFMGMVNYGKTIRLCSDLNMFWFREYYLEATGGKRIQYPIESSPPWIFASYVIQSGDPALVENLLYVLDLYNDSAQYALTTLKRKFLYDEIEAEVNLVFEQMVHRLGEKVYGYYRSIAACRYFNKSIKGDVLRFMRQNDKKMLQEAQIPFQPDHRYHILFKQKSVMLLGREINLSQLLSQRLMLQIRKSISYAFSIFESKGLDEVMEFHDLIQVTKLTHEILSKLDLYLLDFNCLFNEVNQTVKSHMSKFALHTLWDMVNDVIPNYAFSSTTQKMVRGKMSFVKGVERSKPPPTLYSHLFGTKSMTSVFKLRCNIMSGFIGAKHYSVILYYLGYDGLAIIIDQITRFLTVLITEKFSKYVAVLRQGMPVKIALPKFQYGLAGIIKFYTVNFGNMFKYKDLYPRVFQCMREIGNTFIIVNNLESGLRKQEVMNSTFTALYQGVIPGTTGPMIKSMMSSAGFISKLSDGLSKNDREHFVNAQRFSSEMLSIGLSFFDYLLYAIKIKLNQEPWTRQVAKNAVVDLDDCRDFNRIFSVLCVCMVHTAPPGDHTIEEIYGDGLLWSGMVLVELLNESKLMEGIDFINHALRAAEFEDIEKSLQTNGTSSSRSQQLKLLKSGGISGGTVNSSNTGIDISNEVIKAKILPKMKSIANRRKIISSRIKHFVDSALFGTTEQIRFYSTPTFYE